MNRRWWSSSVSIWEHGAQTATERRMGAIKFATLFAVAAVAGSACSQPTTSQPTSRLSAWCADAPVPSGWGRADTTSANIILAAPIEAYGGHSEAGIPDVHNNITAGIGRGNLGQFVVSESRARERLASGMLAPAQNPPVNVDGYTTYEELPRDSNTYWLLVSSSGDSSGRCTIYNSTTLAQRCDFVFASQESRSAMRVFVPTRIVQELPKIIADLDVIVAFASANCLSEDE